MINMAYIRLVWKNHKAFALFSMLLITLLQFLILYLITTFDTTAIISAVLAQLPESMRVFLQDGFLSTLNYDGAAAFGFNHPLVLALLVTIAINIPVHHITHELDSGTLELLLAHPLRRNTLLLSLWTSGVIIILIIIFTAVIGSLVAIVLFHSLTGGILIRILQIGFNLWLLISLIFSYTLLIAVFSKTGSRAGNLSAVITFVLYLMSFLSGVWSAMAFLKPFNIFSYYEPQKLMFSQGHFVKDIIVLSAVILLCAGISLKQFARRDIP